MLPLYEQYILYRVCPPPHKPQVGGEDKESHQRTSRLPLWPAIIKLILGKTNMAEDSLQANDSTVRKRRGVVQDFPEIIWQQI